MHRGRAVADSQEAGRPREDEPSGCSFAGQAASRPRTYGSMGSRRRPRGHAGSETGGQSRFGLWQTGSSFLAFAAISHKRGEPVAAYPGKGIRFIGGLTEGAETIAVFVAFCMFPDAFAVIAYGFAVLAGFTTLTRWWWDWRVFGQARTP